MIVFKSRRIPLMEEGPERELMTYFLERVKYRRGLTTALVQRAGVKSQWLKPEEPRNFPVRRFLRIMIHIMHEFERDEFEEWFGKILDHTYKHILPAYTDDLIQKAHKRKQRPPSIRCLY